MPFLSGWTKEKLITIPAAYITGSMVDFPLTIQIINDAQIGAAARADGYDLRFTLSDGTTLLSYERESFAIAGGLANGLYHVKLPSLTSGVNATLYCQYGKADAPDGQAATAAWNANFAGVWHFGTASSLSLLDSTGNDNDGTVVGTVAAIAGKVGGGANFGNQAGHITLSDSASLKITGPWTISGWSYWTGGAGSALNPMFSRWNASGNVGFDLHRHTTGALSSYCYNTTGVTLNGTTVLGANWYHVAGTCTGNSGLLSIYLNGNSDATPIACNAPGDSQVGARIGDGAWSASIRWKGYLDEIRVSNVARPLAWLALEYNCVANQSSVVTWGAEQAAITLVEPAVQNASAALQSPTVHVSTTEFPMALTVTLNDAIVQRAGPAIPSWSPETGRGVTKGFGRSAGNTSRGGSGTSGVPVIVPQRGGTYGRRA